jgi:hypothetical protein
VTPSTSRLARAEYALRLESVVAYQSPEGSIDGIAFFF